MIIVDTREKKWDHIRSYFGSVGEEWIQQKLDVGDYMDPDRPLIIVDRKQNLSEVATNLCSKDDGRFWRELRRAHESGIRLYVLVEHGRSVKELRDVAAWKSPYSKITGKRLLDEMYRVAFAYGVEWRFCEKKDTGKKIKELLWQGEDT